MRFHVRPFEDGTRAYVAEANVTIQIGDEQPFRATLARGGFAREEDAARWAENMNAQLEQSNLGASNGPFQLHDPRHAMQPGCGACHNGSLAPHVVQCEADAE